MIRTEIVKLTIIPAIAFRHKLKSGGSGITIIRYGGKQPGIASISKTSGAPVPTDNTSAEWYPEEAFREAAELTAGMPYSKRGTVKIEKEKPVNVTPAPTEEATEDDTVIDSADYQKVYDKYTDKEGKLSYELLNRDLIKFAHSSSTVRRMIEDGESTNTIRTYIVTSKFRTVTGNKNLTEEQAMKIAELLDEVSPKGVFKELDAELRRMSSAKKGKK